MEPMEPELTNDRGRREWAWLVRRVGQDRAEAAVAAAVQRGRRAYPLNAARELGIELPPPDQLPPLRSVRSGEVAAQALADIRRALGR